MAKDSMTEGMSRKNPPGRDSSFKPMTTRTVDDGATRKETAANQKTLGPRTA